MQTGNSRRIKQLAFLTAVESFVVGFVVCLLRSGGNMAGDCFPEVRDLP